MRIRSTTSAIKKIRVGCGVGGGMNFAEQILVTEPILGIFAKFNFTILSAKLLGFKVVKILLLETTFFSKTFYKTFSW